MNGKDFFQMAMMTALTLLGITAVLGVIRKRSRWDIAERAGLWLALEIGLFAALFALLPQPLLYAFGLEEPVWRFSSLALVGYLGFLVLTIGDKQRRFGAQFPLIMRLLLALCMLCLTLELVNAVWWGSLAGYAFGVLWLVALAGIQFIAFVCYDRLDQHERVDYPNPSRVHERYETNPQPQRQPQPASTTILRQRITPSAGGGGHLHGTPAVNGVHRRANPNHPDGTPDPHAHQQPAEWLPRDPNRYSDDHQIAAHRGSLPNTLVRSDEDILRRGSRRNRNPHP